MITGNLLGKLVKTEEVGHNWLKLRINDRTVVVIRADHIRNHYVVADMGKGHSLLLQDIRCMPRKHKMHIFFRPVYCPSDAILRKGKKKNKGCVTIFAHSKYYGQPEVIYMVDRLKK